VSTDDEVVAAAKRGDAEAWRALYRAHAGRLLVWLSTRPSGDSAVTAEDLAAESWLVAAERIHSFEGTSSDFAGWLFGVARNLGGNTHRRSMRRGTYATDPHELGEPGVVPGPEPAYAAQDWVVRALATLPPREREVVGCLDVVGLDVETTAHALGMSSVAVRVARHRGLKRLRLNAPGPQDTSSERSPSR
jgi:RNA polymerase sigma-70 factor (ECF subfamily)